MRTTVPEILILAGPNGAGKSTLATRLLPSGMEFVNADDIARGLPADFPGNREIEAGRLLLARMDALAAEGRSLAVETTLASRGLAPRIARMREQGYRFHLIFVASPSVDLCIARVASRVRAGGHDIPEETIRRRYVAGPQNLYERYVPIADTWRVYQNTDFGPYTAQASGGGPSESADGSEPSVAYCDPVRIERASAEAVCEAMREHRRLGNVVAVWRDERVVLVPADRIPDDPLAYGLSPSGL